MKMILKLTCNLSSQNGVEDDENGETITEKVKAVVEDLLFDLDDWKAYDIRIEQE